MVIYNEYPTTRNPLVQLNYPNGITSFCKQYNSTGKDIYYVGKVVAIFKCKPKP